MFAGVGDRFFGECVEVFGGFAEAASGGDVFAVTPGGFDGVEFWGVGRQVFQMHVANLLAPSDQFRRFVLTKVVEHHDQRCSQPSSQAAQVRDQVRRRHAATGQEIRVQPATATSRREGQRPQQGDLQAVSQTVLDQRRHSLQSPGAFEIRNRLQGRFIEKTERRSATPRFF